MRGPDVKPVPKNRSVRGAADAAGCRHKSSSAAGTTTRPGLGLEESRVSVNYFSHLNVVELGTSRIKSYPCP